MADPCPVCGKNRDIVGRTHKCVPFSQPSQREIVATPPKVKPTSKSARKSGKRDLAEIADPNIRQVVVERLQRDADAKGSLPRHPDCEWCNDYLRKQRETMRKRRGKA